MRAGTHLVSTDGSISLTSKITQIPGILFAPLNIQTQNTINERGEIMIKVGSGSRALQLTAGSTKTN